MDTKLLIGDENVAAEHGRIFERRNPVTGEVATRAAAASVADANAAAEAAAAAFGEWAATGPGKRRALLLKAAELLEAHAPQFTSLMAAETGATAAWVGFNVTLAAKVIREAAALTTQITGETIPSDKPGCLSITIRQPAGVILSIVPWNGPIVLAARASPIQSPAGIRWCSKLPRSVPRRIV
jgi:vanillin dehydrogenase